MWWRTPSPEASSDGTMRGSCIGFIGGGSSRSSSPSSPFSSRPDASSSPPPCLFPISTDTFLSEGVFFRGGRSGAPLFSTFPWLSFRSGGGSHFLLKQKKQTAFITPKHDVFRCKRKGTYDGRPSSYWRSAGQRMNKTLAPSGQCPGHKYQLRTWQKRK